MAEREKYTFGIEASDFPPTSREPLIKFPDRNISLIFINHGSLGEPFPDRETLEREIDTVFGGRIDAIVPDSFPPNEKGWDLTPAVIANSLNRPHDQLDFTEWAIWTSIEKDASVIGADPYARSPRLQNLMDKEELKIHESYIPQVYIPNRGKFSPEYRSLDSRESTLAGLHTSLEIVLGFQILRMVKKIVELAEKNRAVYVDRRGFIVGAGISLLAAGIEGLLKNEEYALSEKKRKFLKEYENNTDPALEIHRDFVKIMKLFSEGIELSQEHFDDPSFQRRAFINKERILGTVLRNALIAETLTLPLPEILPWKKSGYKANIVAPYGFEHIAVPENMRISYFVRNSEKRKAFIRLALSENFTDGLIDELATGTSYKISGDGAYVEQNFGLRFLGSKHQ